MMNYLEHNKQLLERAGIPADIGQLTGILNKYPWFTTARILLDAGNTARDPGLALHMQFHPCPEPMLHSVTAPVMAGKGHDDIIDNFLNKGEYRIVPDEATPENDAAEKSSVLEVTDEMATEELAEIYMSQGMEKEAREIYERLGKTKKP